jgi:hypothetical protein
MSKQRNRTSTNTPEVDTLKKTFDEKDNQLKIQKKRLNEMLSDDTADISKMGILRDLVDKLNQELAVTKSSLRELGFFVGIPERPTTDNQTIISSAAVRRKTEKDLQEPEPKPTKN